MQKMFMTITQDQVNKPNFTASYIQGEVIVNEQFNARSNVDIMNKGASMLVGKHNFNAFSKSNLDNSICSVKSACWIKSKNMLLFSIESDRFLYNMVRCIVGTLINLGLEKISLQDFSQIMSDCNRSKSGYSVPACGLYLMNVKYPKLFEI